MQNYTLFIADLHLTPDRPDITDAFIHFTQSIDSQCDALYILGDFFEAWIGDDDQSPFNLEIAAVLKAIPVPVYFIHGNRDFLLKSRYAAQAGMTLLNEQAVIDLYGRKTLICHGDEMCTQDEVYQAFRKKSRGWWWPRLMLTMPLWYRRRVAQNARARSIAAQKGKPPEILDVTLEGVTELFRRYDVCHMIHGHTHRPDVHTYEIDGKTRTRTVLGDWYTQSSYLKATADGNELVFNPLTKKSA